MFAFNNSNHKRVKKKVTVIKWGIFLASTCIDKYIVLADNSDFLMHLFMSISIRKYYKEEVIISTFY